MPRRAMSEEERAAASARMKARWAEKKSRSQEAIEHVASGVLRSELDEIESAIDRRESKLSRLQTDEEVAGMRVTAANEQLRKMNDLSSKAKEKLDDQMRIHEKVRQGYEREMERMKREVTEQRQLLIRQVESLDKLKSEISERTTYREQQEKEIAEMVEKGNDRLYEVDQEVKEMLRQRDDVQAKLLKMEQEQTDLNMNCAVVGEKLELLKRRYDQSAENYRNDLMAIRVTITEEQENIVHLKATAKQITDELVVKGKAALARESAIAEREKGLVSRERLLKSRESRYS